jgi:glutaredoxin-like protein
MMSMRKKSPAVWFCMLMLFFLAAGRVRTADAAEVLAQKDRDRIQEQLKGLTGEVSMIMFTQELECQYCAQTRELLEELAAMSDKLTLTVLDFVKDQEAVRAYAVDKIPATVLLAGQDQGIRYYGVPAGYELSALVETIRDLSFGDPGLDQKLLDRLTGLSENIHIQVFVTPTCPYCPGAVRTAYRLAQAHPRIRADAVEIVEFPFLGTKYHVRGVPMVVIDENTSFVGAQSEDFFVEKIFQAAEKSGEEGKENQ